MKTFPKTILIVPLIVSIALAVVMFFQVGSNPEGDTAAYDSTKNYDSILVLVNRRHSLPELYRPNDLVVPKIRFADGVTSEEMMMRTEAGKALEELFKKAKSQGVELYGVSGYRSYDTQNETYLSRVRSQGRKEADKYVAYPGQSEHQTGLAMDVTGETALNDSKTGGFENTKEGIWLKKNAYKFGFIIRYPYGKEDITGYNYEPWHIRYVGTKTAKEIYDKGMVLEEYLNDGSSSIF